MSAPSFSSFPDVFEAKAGESSKTGSRYTSKRERSPDEDERRRRRHGDRPRHLDGEATRTDRRDQDSPRRRAHAEDDRRGERDGHRERERDKGRYRDKERHKDRRPDRDKDRDRESREEKEARRRRERRHAEALVKERRPSPPIDIVKSERPSSTWRDVDDGVPWYETSSKGKAREGYEEPFDPTSSTAFFVDTVGDKDALRYGTTSSYSAPRYRRDGQGRIIGCNEGLRIVLSRQRTEKGLEIAPRGRPYVPRYSSRIIQSSLKDTKRLLIRPDPTNTFDSQTPYISFGSEKRLRDEDDVPSYRSIDKLAEQEDSDDDLTAFNETLGGFSSLEQSVRNQIADMEKHLRAHPDDIDAWISHSNLHRKLTPDNHFAPVGTDLASLPQSKASAEVTLSILAKALEHSPNFRSIRLHLAFIKAAEAFWSPDKVTARWRNVLREVGQLARTDQGLEEGMMELWLGYIEWREGQGFGRQTSPNGDPDGGGVDEMVEVYIECLDQLSRSSHDMDTATREENQLYLFVRACLFLRHAGYTERAFAAFQALVEITLFKPSHLRPPVDPPPSWFSDLLSAFEVFWESEAPRVGEQNGKGWAQSVSLGPPTSASPPDVTYYSEDPFERWRQVEEHAQQHAILPARASDLDAGDDDPFRVVLFDDIKAFMFPIRSPQVRLQLIYAFLNFIGLPFRPPGISTTSSLSSDPHLNWTLMYNDGVRASFWPPKLSHRQLPWQTVGGEPMEPESSRAMSNPFTCPVKNWVASSESFFPPPDKWFGSISSLDLAHVDNTFARNTLNLLQPLVSDPSFTSLSLVLESAISLKSATKLAKSILATDRENAGIWSAYAQLERHRGNLNAARAVYATVLQSMTDRRTSGETSEEERELWASWAQMEWEEDEVDRCLHILIAAIGVEAQSLEKLSRPDPTPIHPSSISILKAAQRYSTLSHPYSQPTLILASVFALRSKSIDSAQSLIVRQIASLEKQSAEVEEAHQWLNHLLYIHTSRNPSPASMTRDPLELAIAAFPDNTQFLSLYHWGELGGRIYGRIQRLITHLLSNESSGIVSHLWSVWAEAMSSHRTFWDQGGGGAERVRNALDKSVNSLLGKRSAPMWMLYIEFETLMGRYSTAKQLCYRAVAALGGCKPLYMMPFSSSLRPHFTDQELRDWAELMTERGLRIRVPFEHFFDPNEMAAAIELPEDEELQDDELRFLQDREEAKPY